MDYALIAGLALALVTVVIVAWDALRDSNDNPAADTLKSLRG